MTAWRGRSTIGSRRMFFCGSDASQRRRSLSRCFAVVRGPQCKGKLTVHLSVQYCGTELTTRPLRLLNPLRKPA